jgi:hypothetical protein
MGTKGSERALEEVLDMLIQDDALDIAESTLAGVEHTFSRYEEYVAKIKERRLSDEKADA